MPIAQHTEGSTILRRIHGLDGPVTQMVSQTGGLLILDISARIEGPSEQTR